MTPLDWGDGDYARTARVLAPAAGVALDAARVIPGNRVLDVACGTGNAAWGAVARGATAVGVDASETLLELARQGGEEGAEFVRGDMSALPVGDGEFDVALSVFGVIFADDPEAAATELRRVLRPQGRLALTSWAPEGPIAAASRCLRAVLPVATDRPSRWGDEAWVTDLLKGLGFDEVVTTGHHLAFRAASPEAWFAEQEELHPVWRWGRRQVDEQRWRRVRDATVQILDEANEDPDAFRATSRYLVVTAQR